VREIIGRKEQKSVVIEKVSSVWRVNRPEDASSLQQFIEKPVSSATCQFGCGRLLSGELNPAISRTAGRRKARPISPGSRTLAGFTSTLSDGATAWMAANWLVPEPWVGIPKDRRSLTSPHSIEFHSVPSQGRIAEYRIGRD